MILNAFDGKPLPVYGDGLYVREPGSTWRITREAIDLVLEGGASGEVYNIGAENERPEASTSCGPSSA